MIRHRTNHGFFGKWTEISAYIFGFWWADGCIWLKNKGNKYPLTCRYQKVFKLTNTDAQIMSRIADILDCNARPQFPKRPNRKVYYVIDICSNEFFDFCYQFTGGTTKSNRGLGLPPIPSRVFRHFVRGFFDGDGSIFWTATHSRHGKPISRLATSFAAGQKDGRFLTELRDRIRSFVPVGYKKIVCSKTNSKLSFNQYDTMLLCEWMYKGATIFMKRKKKIWDNTDKTRIKQSKIYFSNKV